MSEGDKKTENKKVCDIIPMTVKNYYQMSVINKALLPVSYEESFYLNQMKLKDTINYSKFGIYLLFILLAIYDMDIVAGGMLARKETKENGKTAYYIMTIGVLKPYQKLGLGASLANSLIEAAKKDNNSEEVYLHVWVENHEAIKFYEKLNFKNVSTIENYYTGINNPHAYILSLPITH